MKVVNKPLRKKDAMQLVTGQPVYMDDVIPEGCLCVKLLRSPHANAIVESINTAAAMKVPGMERIFTWEDVPQDGRRYTQAGQTYPEASPYDRLVIDRHVRFVGDVVAIVAGEDEKCVDKAMRLIKVKYKVLEPLFDFTKAKDNPILVHPEDNWESLAPVGADNKRNLCAHDQCGSGDIDEVLRTSDIVIDRVYHTRACQQAMMETNLLQHRRLRPSERAQLDPDRVPYAPHHRQRAAHPEEHDPRLQAAHRRRLRREADRGQRSLSGVRHVDDEKALQDHFQPC